MGRSEMSGGGWFDFSLVGKAAHLNFNSSIVPTKPDVLAGIDPNLHRV
ncbi:MAG: hypothetical protein U9N36_01615 [Euryarchaeota archaeon]|nr:hypothetical protein [Euryarchaeota archaeon]